MKRFLTAITSFFRRFKTAWQVSGHPHLLEAIRNFEKQQEKKREFQEFLDGLHGIMPAFARSMLPEGRHEMSADDPRLPVKLTMKSERLLTAAEADEVLKESRTRQRLPQSHTAKARKRLAQYEDKLKKRPM